MPELKCWPVVYRVCVWVISYIYPAAAEATAAVILHIFCFPSPSDSPPSLNRRKKMTQEKGNIYRTRERQRKILPLLLPKEGQDCGGCSVVLEEHPDGRRPPIVPSACLSDALLHFLAPWGPCPVLDEEAAAGLPLLAAAPPALSRLDLLYLVGQIGPGRSVVRKELADLLANSFPPF